MTDDEFDRACERMYVAAQTLPLLGRPREVEAVLVKYRGIDQPVPVPAPDPDPATGRYRNSIPGTRKNPRPGDDPARFVCRLFDPNRPDEWPESSPAVLLSFAPAARPLVSRRPAEPSPDYRQVDWMDERGDPVEYHFSRMQARVVELLMRAGGRDVSQERLMADAESDAQKPSLYRLFNLPRKKHPAWGTLILRGATSGTYHIHPHALPARAPATPAAQH